MCILGELLSVYIHNIPYAHKHTLPTIDTDSLTYPHVCKQCLQLSLGDKIGGIRCDQLDKERERERESKELRE